MPGSRMTEHSGQVIESILILMQVPGFELRALISLRASSYNSLKLHKLLKLLVICLKVNNDVDNVVLFLWKNNLKLIMVRISNRKVFFYFCLKLKTR